MATLLAVHLGEAAPAGIVDNQASPHVTFRSVGIGECEWTEGFWADKFQLAAEVMVPHMGDLLKSDTGHALNNFKIAAGLKEGKFQGMWWHDGDFYKWMEAATFIYAQTRDPAIRADLDELIDLIGTVQLDSGYLSTPIQINGWEPYSERRFHELYNSGHLLNAACIHHRVTGQRNFLDIAIKHADFLVETFMPQPDHLARFAFNPTQISGLVELYRTTGKRDYLELAQLFIDKRGRNKSLGLDAVRTQMVGDMSQDRTPFRQEDEAVGHAVLAMYLYSGAADVYAETGEQALRDTLDRIWENVVDRKMYVTGAVGQGHHGSSSQVDFVHEAFLAEFQMHNAYAYNETCANVCNAMFNWRMLGLSGDARYADVIELVLYNSALSGISADGKTYFYTNPLRRTSDQHLGPTDYAERTPYIPCFCCPPNLVRTIAKSAGWAYSQTEDGIAVNLYGGNRLETQLPDGATVRLRQETDYPWDGAIRITVEECEDTPFTLSLRIPGWSRSAELSINGEPVTADLTPATYAELNRSWQVGDVIELNLPMPVEMLEGHPRIEEVRNQVAVKRGPVVYCLESPDLPSNIDVLDVYLSAASSLEPVYQPDLLGGIVTIQGEALTRPGGDGGMYRPVDVPDWESVSLSLTPYYAWSNRGLAEMSVFLPVVWR